MWSPSANDVGVAFCCCFRSVRSACRSDLICRISDWISAKKESSLSSLSGLITANLKPLLDVNRPSTCKGCCKPYQRQLKNGHQWRKFVSTYPSRPASIAAVHESVVGPSVWTGRALQGENDDLEKVGLALLYPAH